MFCVFLYLFILYCCVSTVVFSFLMNPRPPRTTRTHPRFPYNDALPISGQTLNVMTLSGLALAIGILVDDATVTIENINWHLENGRSEEHTSELQSLMRISYAVFCLK